MTQVRTILLLLVTALAAAAPAKSVLSQVSAAPRNPGPTNNTVLVGFLPGDYPFLNFFRMSGQFKSGNYAAPTDYPAYLDANGYPNNTATLGPLPPGGIAGIVGLPNDYCNYHWKIDWHGTAGNSTHPGWSLSGRGPAAFTLYDPTTHTVISGSPFVSGSYSYDLSGFGTNGVIEFKFNKCGTGGMDNAASGNQAFAWRQGALFSNLTNMRLYRCLPNCDIATIRIDHGGNFGGFNPDFIQKIKEINPGWLRMLNWTSTAVYNNLTSNKYATPVTAFTYADQYWDPAAWVGTIYCRFASGAKCNSDAYSATLPSVDLDTNGLPADGTTIQGYIESSNTTTEPTFSLNGGPAIPIVLFGTGAVAHFKGSISGTTMTVSSMSSGGAIGRNAALLTFCETCTTPVAIGTTITGNATSGSDLCTPACTGTGGVGTYAVSVSQNVPSGTGMFTPGIASGQMNQHGVLTLFYNKTLKLWFTSTYGPRGIVSGVPLEVMIDLANATNTNLWLNMPPYIVDDGSSATIATIIKNRLNPQLKFAEEYGNEIWNNVPATSYAQTAGEALLGMNYYDDHDIRSFYAYRSKKIFDEMLPVFGSFERYYPVLATQFGNGEYKSDEVWRFGGYGLCGTAPSCPVSNATYQAKVVDRGGADYNTAPHRPIDEARIISVAPYWQGATCTFINYTGDASNYDALAIAADRWLSGDTADAFKFLTSDIIGSATQWAPTVETLYKDQAILAAWESLAKRESAETGHTISILHYEGGMQCAGPPLENCNGTALSRYLDLIGTGKIRTGNGPQGQPGPDYYCGANAPGYVVGDIVTNGPGSGGLRGFQYRIDSVAPDGTPLTGHIIPGRAGSGWTGGPSGTGTIVGNYLNGGSGFGLQADLTLVNGSVTNAVLHSGLIQIMINAYKQSTAFETLMICAWTGRPASTCKTIEGGTIIPGFVSSTYPSTLGSAQYEMAGQGIGAPWALFLQDIYGSRYMSFDALRRINMP